MALVTTPGAADADSYASLTEAADYTAAHGLAWVDNPANFEAALRRATAWIDATYRTRFPGSRVNGRGQALEWPRAGAADAEGYAIDADAIPIEVVRATIEAAVRELAAPQSLTPDISLASQVKREKVGSIEVEYRGGDLDASKITVSTVENLLSGIVERAGATRFLGRA